jgi:hypothetical protein
MAGRTKCYEITFFVVPEMTSGLNMVYLEVLQAAAVLATPSIPLEYSFP